jgi:hypothetical protein
VSLEIKIAIAALAVAVITGIITWLQLRKKDPPTTSLKQSPVEGSAIISGSNNQINFHSSPAQPQPTLLKTEPTRERPKANIQYIDALTICLGDRFNKSPKNALAIRFSNDARPDVENVTADVRAKLLYFDGEKEIHAVTGNWLDEAHDYADFQIDGRYTLVVGQVIRGKLHIHTKRKHHTGLYEVFQTEVEPLENFQTGTVIARLTNANTGEWILEKRFKISVDPLSIEPAEERKLSVSTTDEVVDVEALADEVLSFARRVKQNYPNRPFDESVLRTKFQMTEQQVARAMDILRKRGEANPTASPGLWLISP